jgi:hypothetical protein
VRSLASLLAVLVLSTTAQAEVPAALARGAREAATTGDPGALWRAVAAHPDFLLERDDVVELARGLGPRIAAQDMDTLFFHHATRITKQGRTVTIERELESSFQVERPDGGEALSSRIFWFFVARRVALEVACDAGGVTLKTTGLRWRSIWDAPDHRVQVRSMRFDRRPSGGALWTTTLGNWPIFTTKRCHELRPPTDGIASRLPGR